MFVSFSVLEVALKSRCKFSVILPEGGSCGQPKDHSIQFLKIASRCIGSSLESVPFASDTGEQYMHLL